MAAVADHAERCVQSARELEAVREGELAVAGSPENKRRAAKLAELRPDVVYHDRSRGADRVTRQLRPREEAVDGRRRETQRVGRSPEAKDCGAQERTVADGVRPGRDEATGPDDPEDPQPVSRTTRRRRDPGRR